MANVMDSGGGGASNPINTGFDQDAFIEAWKRRDEEIKAAQERGNDWGKWIKTDDSGGGGELDNPIYYEPEQQEEEEEQVIEPVKRSGYDRAEELALRVDRDRTRGACRVPVALAEEHVLLVIGPPLCWADAESVRET